MEPLKQTEASKEMLCMNQESTSETSSLKIQEVAEVSEETLPETTKTPFVWKGTQHFLGWRKPEKWKKKG